MANILIFEDNAEFAAELSDACERAGQTSHETSSLSTLRKIVDDTYFEIALVDLMVPESGNLGANGVKAISAIRSAEKKHEKQTTVVIVSGSAAFMREGSGEKLLTVLRADGLISKPVSAMVVIDEVTREYLD